MGKHKTKILPKSGAALTAALQRQIALVHRIVDGGIQPDSIEDGWEVWHFTENVNSEPVKKEPIKIREEPKFKRRYKK